MEKQCEYGIICADKCIIKLQVHHQAESGGISANPLWKRRDWDLYIENCISTAGEVHCRESKNLKQELSQITHIKEQNREFTE